MLDQRRILTLRIYTSHHSLVCHLRRTKSNERPPRSKYLPSSAKIRYLIGLPNSNKNATPNTRSRSGRQWLVLIRDSPQGGHCLVRPVWKRIPCCFLVPVRLPMLC